MRCRRMAAKEGQHFSGPGSTWTHCSLHRLAIGPRTEDPHGRSQHSNALQDGYGREDRRELNYVKKIIAVDGRGDRRRMQGRVAPVHKPLASAGSVCDAGADVYLGGEGGYIEGGKFMEKLRKAFDKIASEEGYMDPAPVYSKNGVYNFCTQVQSLALDVSASDVEMQSKTAAGGPRPANQP